MLASPQSNHNHSSQKTPFIVWMVAISLAFSSHGIILWEIQQKREENPSNPRYLTVEWIQPKVPKVLPPKKESRQQNTSKTSEKLTLNVKIKQPKKEILLNKLIQETPEKQLGLKMQKSSRSSSSEKKYTLLVEKNSQRNFTSSPKKSRAKGKTKQKSNPIKRHEHSEIDNNYSLDLKNIVAIIKPKIKDPKNHDLLFSDRLKPLPENWMMKKFQPLSTTSDNQKRMMSSFLENIWITEIEKNSSDRIPPPPGKSESPGSGFYTLSNYDWPYESYMGRWAKTLLYYWRNNPPKDYIKGRHPQGGEIFVLVSVQRNGQMNRYEVTDHRHVSKAMEHSVVNAVLGTSQLPPLPKDLASDELKVHFRFIYPPLNSKDI